MGFIVTCDASSNRIGSLLNQGTLGHDMPVAYVIRVLTKAERNHSTLEGELITLFGVASNLGSKFGAENLRF